MLFDMQRNTKSAPLPRGSSQDKAVVSGTKGRTGHVSTTLLISSINAEHRGDAYQVLIP